MTDMDFRTRLTTFEAAKAWIEDLYKADLLFHFEDDPAEIVSGMHAKRTFADRDVPNVRRRVAELYTFQWGEFECPIGYALHVMNQEEK